MDFKLILKKINGSLSDSEKMQFDSWYQESPEHQQFFRKVRAQVLTKKEQVDAEAAWNEVQVKLAVPKKRKRKLWPVAIAASLAAVLTVGVYLNQQKVDYASPISSPIESGAHRAVLTLEDGEEVFLGEHSTFHQANSTTRDQSLVYHQPPAESTEKIVYNTLSIPKSGQYKLVLTDGTQVWLNSDTRIKYPTAFIADQPREVELIYGEAFFEVTPSKRVKTNNFFVKSQGQTIEVIGTAFNVRNYTEEDQIETTLVEGEVSVLNAISGQQMTLMPNEQVSLRTHTGHWQKKVVNPEYATAWKQGYFKFKEESLHTIMRAISRWYDVEVHFENEELKELEFNGVFSKNQELEKIIEILEFGGAIEFSINDHQITVRQSK